jgi:cobalt-zinc-cadmium efflux system outer membrane protein
MPFLLGRAPVSRTFIGVSLRARRWLPGCRTQRGAIAAALVVGLILPGIALAQSARPLRMSEALRQAAAGNPRLAAARIEIDMAYGRRVQAGAIPNPELSFELDNALGSGAYRDLKSAETTLLLSQVIEFRGKRGARIAAGSAEVDQFGWQLEALRLEILTDVAATYINVAAAQRRLQVYDAHLGALDRLLPLLRRRVEAGASSPADTARAEVAGDLLRADRERASAALAVARLELASLMGLPKPNFGRVVGDLSRTSRPPSLAAVLAMVDGLPQLVRWTALRAQRDAELILARLKPYPDMRVSAGWRHYNDTGDDAVRLGLSFSLPVFDRNTGGIIEAEAARTKVEADRAAGKAALVLTLGRAYETLVGSLRELDILRRSALPNARRAQEAIEQGYEQGRFTLLEYLDVQNTVTQASLRELEALLNYHIAVATIEGLTGAALGTSK